MAVKGNKDLILHVFWVLHGEDRVSQISNNLSISLVSWSGEMSSLHPYGGNKKDTVFKIVS